MKKIAIVGPESTGKSELAQQLAYHFKCNWVKEYAREYLEKLNHSYSYADLKIIAKGQIKSEDISLIKNNDFLFLDTTLMVIKVWSEFKYNKVDDWILKEYQRRKYDLYLLCDIDLPWEDDPLREHPDKRKELLEIYKNEIKNTKTPFFIISGTGRKRVNNAITIVNNHLNKKQDSIKF